MIEYKFEFAALVRIRVIKSFFCRSLQCLVGPF